MAGAMPISREDFDCLSLGGHGAQGGVLHDAFKWPPVSLADSYVSEQKGPAGLAGGGTDALDAMWAATSQMRDPLSGANTPFLGNSNEPALPHSTPSNVEIVGHPVFEKLVSAIFTGRTIGEDSGGTRAIEAQKEVSMASIHESRRALKACGPRPQNRTLRNHLERMCNQAEDLNHELAVQSFEANKACDFFHQQIVKILKMSNAGGPAPTEGDNSSSAATAGGHVSRGTRAYLKRCYAEAIRNLNDEFVSRKKKGKLPNEATSRLKQWWHENLAWPYPSEAAKQELEIETGLTVVQINNWFINQRKRHWHKYFEDGQHPATPEAARAALKEAGVLQ